MTDRQPPSPQPRLFRSWGIALAVLLALVAYAAFRPSLERMLGLSPPAGPVVGEPAAEGASDPPPSPTAPRATAPPTPSATEPGVEPAARPSKVPLDRPPPSRATPGVNSGRDADEPRLGQLTDIGDGVKRSSAGLRYTPGSEEGHRLKHVLRHDNDIPDRPGSHGVFDGDADTLLAVIDEAYLLVKAGGPRVQTERQGARQVHEVDMRRRIGFVGGQVGQRRRHPPATHVRLILEGDRVISAFPF